MPHITRGHLVGLGMNTALWIAAGVLAAAMLASGALKLALPREKLAAAGGGSWAEDFGAGTINIIGVLEVLAAIGLILPALLDIAPVFVPLAAVGVMLLMAGAMVVHVRRHEARYVVANLVYLAVAAFVAWGRFTG
jgi:hypothetical protein